MSRMELKRRQDHDHSFRCVVGTVTVIPFGNKIEFSEKSNQSGRRFRREGDRMSRRIALTCVDYIIVLMIRPLGLIN